VAEVRVVARGGQRDLLGEGLLWSARDNAVYWTDILAPALNRLSLADGSVQRWPMPEYIGWVIERRGGGFIAGLKSGFFELDLEPFALRAIVNPHPDIPDNRMNDAKADAQGRIWAGSMPFGADKPSGKLHRLDADRTLHTLDDGYFVANGPTFSLDQTWLYHTDTVKGLVYRFALAADGTLGPRETFITFEKDWGRPDGMTTDADGHLWIAHWSGSRISRFTPDGRMERSIVLPASQITNICFAGETLDRMFVTSAAEGKETTEADAGCLFEILGHGSRGLPPGQFAG
jgi:sugar lactone lactonase YvrE